MGEGLTVNPEEWDRVQELFLRVVEQPLAHRQSFIEEACEGDLRLREELTSLLRSHEARGILDTSGEGGPSPSEKARQLEQVTRAIATRYAVVHLFTAW